MSHTVGVSSGINESRGDPNGTQFFHFCIHFFRKAPASDVVTLSLQREILDPLLSGNAKKNFTHLLEPVP